MWKKVENPMLLIWVTSLIATAGSLYFSEVRHYEPCELCWIQRIFMYPLVIIMGVAYVQKNARITLTSAILATIGGCISLYHYGIQKLSFLSESAPACGRVPCTGEYINWFGFVTIPFLALVAFIIISVTSWIVWAKVKEEK